MAAPLDNRLTPFFFSKLCTLIEACEGTYWNQLGTGFVVVDSSKLQDKVLTISQHGLQTFLKKLRAYGFKRLNLFEGTEYIHADLEYRRLKYLQTEEEVAEHRQKEKEEEERDIEEKLIQQSIIHQKLSDLTKNLQETNNMETMQTQLKKRCSKNDELLNSLMFKVLTEGKGLNKQEVSKQISQLRESIKTNEEDISVTRCNLEKSISQQGSLISVIKDFLERPVPTFDPLPMKTEDPN